MKDFIKVKDIMVLERLLLEIDARFKYEMDFPDAFKLYELLKEVGKITNYAFLIQDEYHEKFHDAEKLREYHIMVINSEILLDYDEIIKFIEYVDFKFKNEEFSNVLNTIKFWDKKK